MVFSFVWFGKELAIGMDRAGPKITLTQPSPIEGEGFLIHVPPA
jgi:hypothetical protein